MTCIFFMIFGVCLFAAGIVFERLSYCEPEEEIPDEEKVTETDLKILRQWENLLGYDGNEQEEEE